MKRPALLLAALLAASASGQSPARRNVLETLTAALARDRAYDAGERARLLTAIQTRFADYAFQVVDERRRAAIPVLLHVITEGSFDEQTPERVADVAFAAYQAMSRGAPAEEVEGIALYGYSRRLSGDTIAAWANGYRQMVDAGVPGPVAADLVNLAERRGLPDSDFDALKWALVDGVKEGFDAKDYAIFLFGRAEEGKAGPGAISGEAKAEFLRARAEKRRPRLPHYVGIFNAPPPPPPVFEAPVPPQSPSPAAPEARRAPVVRAPPAAAERAPAPPPAREEKPAPGSSGVGDSPRLAALWPGLDTSAHSYLGTPYVWGGTSHAGIDCSGLTSNVYGENRVRIPRVSRDQYRVGNAVDDVGLRDGDLVFFDTLGVGVSHVGMIVDARKRLFVQASSSKGVTITALDGKYYKTRYLGARRVVP
jgi:cell wall-associated NlpC family hydrolase